MERISESTVARIAGNLLSGVAFRLSATGQRQYVSHLDETVVAHAVRVARQIVAEVQRTAKTDETGA